MNKIPALTPNSKTLSAFQAFTFWACEKCNFHYRPQFIEPDQSEGICPECEHIQSHPHEKAKYFIKFVGTRCPLCGNKDATVITTSHYRQTICRKCAQKDTRLTNHIIGEYVILPPNWEKINP